MDALPHLALFITLCDSTSQRISHIYCTLHSLHLQLSFFSPKPPPTLFSCAIYITVSVDQNFSTKNSSFPFWVEVISLYLYPFFYLALLCWIYISPAHVTSHSHSIYFPPHERPTYHFFLLHYNKLTSKLTYVLTTLHMNPPSTESWILYHQTISNWEYYITFFLSSLHPSLTIYNLPLASDIPPPHYTTKNMTCSTRSFPSEITIYSQAQHLLLRKKNLPRLVKSAFHNIHMQHVPKSFC